MAYREGRQRPDLIAKAEEYNRRFNERKLTAQQLADGIDAYFDACKVGNVKPTKPGLCTALGISTSTWDNWLRAGTGDDKGVRRAQGEYIWPMKRAMQVIADGLEQRTDTMALFLLKQPCYGGYTDRGDGRQGGNLSVSITFGETHKNTARNYGK